MAAETTYTVDGVPFRHTPWAEQVCEICRQHTIRDPFADHRRICANLVHAIENGGTPHNQLADCGDITFIDEEPFQRDVFDRITSHDWDEVQEAE